MLWMRGVTRRHEVRLLLKIRREWSMFRPREMSSRWCRHLIPCHRQHRNHWRGLLSVDIYKTQKEGMRKISPWVLRCKEVILYLHP